MIDEALALARAGDVEGAVALLRGDDAPRDDVHRSLLFQLLSAKQRLFEAIEVCHEALRAAASKEAQSTWTLRRGLCFLDAGDTAKAARDLQAVVSLNAVEDQVDRARRGLLECAGIVKRMK